MIPVTTKVVISIDFSKEVSAQNNALLREDRFPMEDAEVRHFVKEHVEALFKYSANTAGAIMKVKTFVGRDSNSRFGEMLPVLRQHLGLKPDDTSKDSVIEKYSSEEALKACCTVYAGSSEWATSFVKMAEGCGYVVEPFFKE